LGFFRSCSEIEAVDGVFVVAGEEVLAAVAFRGRVQFHRGHLHPRRPCTPPSTPSATASPPLAELPDDDLNSLLHMLDALVAKSS
jgi:hypothetical protein